MSAPIFLKKLVRLSTSSSAAVCAPLREDLASALVVAASSISGLLKYDVVISPVRCEGNLTR